MQAAKNMASMVKQTVADGSATVEEKKDKTKAVAEEKVQKMKANDDAGKEEATQEKLEKEKAAEKIKDRKLEEHSAGRHNEIHHKRNAPIGDCPTPADLDMPTENPTQPKISAGNTTLVPQTIVPSTNLTGDIRST